MKKHEREIFRLWRSLAEKLLLLKTCILEFYYKLIISEGKTTQISKKIISIFKRIVLFCIVYAAYKRK